MTIMAVGIEQLRRFAVAWLRMAVALQLVALAPAVLLGGAAGLAVYLPMAVLLATPLVLARQWICRREAPFLRPGYGLVIVYGPALLSLPVVMGDWGWGDVGFFSAAYEVAALLTTALYVALWRLGDRWLGGRDGPRPARRWVLAAVLVVAAGFYLPFLYRADRDDTCMDRGGRILSDGRCDLADRMPE